MTGETYISNENKPDFICSENGDIVINKTEDLQNDLTREGNVEKLNTDNKLYESKRS